MSDNKNISIQDRGWNEMRSILDKELPEKEKKRRFGFWFVLGSAAFVALVLASMFFFTGIEKRTGVGELALEDDKPEITDSHLDVKTVEERKNTELPLATVENYKKEEVKEDVSQLDHPSEFASENDENNIQNHSKNITNPLDYNVSNLTIDNSQKSNLAVPIAEVKKELATVNKTTGNEFIIKKDPVEVNKKESKYGILPSNKKILELEENSLERILLTPISRLPRSNSPLLNFERERGEKRIVLIASKSRKAFAPYLFANTNYQSKSSGYGIGAGLNYGDQDFEFYLETAYLKSSFNKESSGDRLNIVADQESNPAGELSFTEFSPASGYVLSISKFSTLTTSTSEMKFDFGIRKKLFKNFKIDLGLSFARLLKASNNSRLSVIKESSDGSNELSTYGINRTEFYNLGAYSKSDIIPHIGVEYNITPNVVLGFNYNHGLNNLIAEMDLQGISSLSQNDKIYRRNIGAKVRYQF